MPDDYGNSVGTATSLGIGTFKAGNIEVAGDQDWFRVQLTGGISYNFELRGEGSDNGTLSDPFLYLTDANGVTLASNDDSAGLDSYLTFTPTTTGTYYLRADEYGTDNVGSYVITAGMIPQIIGTDQADTLIGTSAGEQIYAGAGNDFVSGGAGDDLLYGGADNDNLVGGLGLDVLSGGEGFDTADYSGLTSSGVTVDMALGIVTSGSGTDRLVGIEAAVGTFVTDIMRGGAGNDRLYAGGDNDTLVGRGGDDLLDGGSGLDIVDFSSLTTSGVTADLAAGTATSADGTDQLVSIEGAIGTNTGDVLIGSGNSDVLRALLGTDTLNGGDGNDLLTGGGGRDTLTGGTGGDRFIYGVIGDSGVGTGLRDTIVGFNHNQGDKIDLSGIDANVGAGGNQAFVFRGTAAFTGAGQVRYVDQGSSIQVLISTDSDRTPEGEIFLSSITTNLVASDFVL